MIKLIYILTFLILTSIYKAQDEVKPRMFNPGFYYAAIANKGLSNLYQSERNSSTPMSETNSKELNNQFYYFGNSFGLNCVIGKSETIKQIVLVNFDLTKSYFEYNNSIQLQTSPGAGYYKRFHQNYTIDRRVQIFGINYGLLIDTENFITEFLLTYNVILKKYDIVNGKAYGNIPYLPSDEVYENRRINSASDTNFFSVKIRYGHNFNIKNHKFYPFLMRNFNLYRLISPQNTFYAKYWYLGIQYTPNFQKKKLQRS